MSKRETKERNPNYKLARMKLHTPNIILKGKSRSEGKIRSRGRGILKCKIRKKKKLIGSRPAWVGY